MALAPSVTAVIPTFRPSENLRSLTAVVAPQVARVVISDDASPCTADGLLHSLAQQDGIEVVRHLANAGVARGLNDGLRVAQTSGASWLLTVDQDSMITETLVFDLVREADRRIATGEALGALGVEVVADVSGEMRYPLLTDGPQATTHEVIQTGTLWNVVALTDIGGFDESLGMDAVDAAACLGLRQTGYRVGVAMGLRVHHAIGESTMVRLGGRNVMITGHSPGRRSSMLRNRLRLFPAEFAQSPRHALRTVRRVTVNQTVGLILEEQRWSKAKGSIRGLFSRHSR